MPRRERRSVTKSVRMTPEEAADADQVVGRMKSEFGVIVREHFAGLKRGLDRKAKGEGEKGSEE